jgi:hypothetical protein
MARKNYAQEAPQDAPGRPERRKGPRTLTVRCDAAWALWLAAAAAHCDLTTADFLAQASARFAELTGHPQRPPRRVERNPRLLGRKASEAIARREG